MEQYSDRRSNRRLLASPSAVKVLSETTDINFLIDRKTRTWIVLGDIPHAETENENHT